MNMGSPLRVMHSQTDDSNPFFALLAGAMPPEVETLRFSWRIGLTGQFDVLHVHWPERLIRGSSVPETLRKRVLATLLLLSVRARRIPVVRTLHNSVPHDPPTWSERVLLRLVDLVTTTTVSLSDMGSGRVRGTVRTIPHGDYHGQYRFSSAAPPLPDRLLYFGRIRPYKGVEELVDVVQGAAELPFHLRIAGRATTPALRQKLEDELANTTRMSGRLDFVPDDELVDEIELATAICLPYREMENSGAMMLALTGGRPVIVPSTRVNHSLAEEVGEDWVICYDPPLDASKLRTAWLRASAGTTIAPDLSARAWSTLSAAYAEVYRDAVRDVGGRSS